MITRPALVSFSLRLVLCCLLLALGYVFGARATNNARDAQLLQQERAAAAQVRSEVQRGERASGDLQAALRDMSTDREALERKARELSKRVPLVVRPVAGAAAGAAGPLAGGAVAPPAQASGGSGEAPGCVVVPASSPDPELSRAAVWMWNSALEGRDAPSGACGSADTSEEACAIGAGVTVTDAWDNQAINARLCAEDRLRHQHLIDFIKGRPQ